MYAFVREDEFHALLEAGLLLIAEYVDEGENHYYESRLTSTSDTKNRIETSDGNQYFKPQRL